MSISLKETQVLSQITDLLYNFLPGSPHPYAASSISFPGVAGPLGLSKYWVGGSKKPAIIQLLQLTLKYRRDKFCSLILEIVRSGIAYRSNKNEPITRDEIVNLNQLINQVSFKIPELWDPEFLDSLPHSHKAENLPKNISNQAEIEKLKNDLIQLTNLKPQERGFAFEKFLNELFSTYKLDPRNSYKITGEQIDGSFQWGSDIYLVEAKWQNKQTDQSELLVLYGKVQGKSTWSRGLFVSYSGFTLDGLTAFSKGRSTNMIGMDSQDLFHILNGEMTLVEAINKKARRAAETGEFFIPVFTLSKGG